MCFVCDVQTHSRVRLSSSVVRGRRANRKDKFYVFRGDTEQKRRRTDTRNRAYCVRVKSYLPLLDVTNF
jgi:hypothetical protein